MIGYVNSTAFIWLKWMGHMLWQVSFLIIIVMMIDMAIRRRAWPNVRYVLWGVVFLKLLIPPVWQMPTSIVSMIQPTVSERITAEYTLLHEESKLTSGIAEQRPDQVAESITAEKATWQTTLFLIWIAGMLFFVLMLAIQMSRLPKRYQKRYDRDTPGWFYAVLGSISTRLHLKKTPSVIFSRNAGGPAVYGLFRPVLVFPRGYFDHLTREQVEHVLLHELTHIKRGDLWVHWFCILLQIIYWFNPLLILARRQLGHVSEICCDLSVANVLKEKTAAYRETLLSISRRFLADAVLPGIGLLGIFEGPSRIIARLKWLEKDTWKNQKRKIATTVLTALVMVLCVMPMNGLSRSAAPNENIQAQSDNSAAEVERGRIQPSDSPLLLQVEALVLEVSDETCFAIENLEWHQDPGFSFSECDDIAIEGKHYLNLDAAFQGLSNLSGVKILSRPKIVTPDNNTATINMGSDGAVDIEGIESLQFKVTPQILEDGRINQEIYLRARWRSNIGLPSTSEAETEIVTPKEGKILAIGHPFRDYQQYGKYILIFMSTKELDESADKK